MLTIIFYSLLFLCCLIIFGKICEEFKKSRQIKSAFSSGGDDFDSDSVKDMTELSNKVRVDIVYNDMSGEQTARVVDVDAIKRQGKITYFRGFCHLRGKECVFRSDRIEKSLDRQSGEIIYDLLAFIKARAKPIPSPKR